MVGRKGERKEGKRENLSGKKSRRVFIIVVSIKWNYNPNFKEICDEE